MKTVAILGATSQIAKDLIERMAAAVDIELLLYGRNLEAIGSWLARKNIEAHVAGYSQYGREPHDAVLNFVGVGDPRRAVELGAGILSLTCEFDQLVLDQLRRHPSRQYIFLSSGAAYCSRFTEPATAETRTELAPNAVGASDFYGVAKLHAEIRHRAAADLAISDVRVFNYFSRTQDIEARFFITDALRAVRDGIIFRTSSDKMVRDYLHPADFHDLMMRLLAHPFRNEAIDCYTRAPASKVEILEALSESHGLSYEVSGDALATVNATGSKPHYYSQHRLAAAIGYKPRFSSLETVLEEAPALLGQGAAFEVLAG